MCKKNLEEKKPSNNCFLPSPVHCEIEAWFSNMKTCLSFFSSPNIQEFTFNSSQKNSHPSRVADVEEPHNWRCTKGQGLLRNGGHQTYAILSQNYVLSRFTRFMNGHHRAFYENHPTLGVFSTNVSLLLMGFQQKSACFRRAFGEPAFKELS